MEGVFQNIVWLETGFFQFSALRIGQAPSFFVACGIRDSGTLDGDLNLLSRMQDGFDQWLHALYMLKTSILYDSLLQPTCQSHRRLVRFHGSWSRQRRNSREHDGAPLFGRLCGCHTGCCRKYWRMAGWTREDSIVASTKSRLSMRGYKHEHVWCASCG